MHVIFATTRNNMPLYAVTQIKKTNWTKSDRGICWQWIHARNLVCCKLANCTKPWGVPRFHSSRGYRVRQARGFHGFCFLFPVDTMGKFSRWHVFCCVLKQVTYKVKCNSYLAPEKPQDRRHFSIGSKSLNHNPRCQSVPICCSCLNRNVTWGHTIPPFLRIIKGATILH